MGKYAIVTDSAANFYPKDLEGRDIYMLPLSITFGEESFRDKYDLNSDELVAQLDQTKPMTSAPLLGDVQDLVEELNGKNYDGILGITMAGALSSTHDVIKASLDQVKAPTRIIDTQTVSVPEAEYIRHAEQLFAEGKDLDVVADLLQKKADANDGVFFAHVYSLDYLIAGGRLSRMQAIVGKALKIIPLVNLDAHGSIQVLDKMRGKKRSIAQLVQYAEDFIGDAPYRLAFVYGRGPEQVEDLKKAAAHLIEGAQTVRTEQISTLIMAHSGPDVAAICVYRINEA